MSTLWVDFNFTIFFSFFRSLNVLRQILYKFSVTSSINLFLRKASPNLLAADNLGLHFTHVWAYFKCLTFYLCICVHYLRILYYIFWLYSLSSNCLQIHSMLCWEPNFMLAVSVSFSLPPLIMSTVGHKHYKLLSLLSITL